MRANPDLNIFEEMLLSQNITELLAASPDLEYPSQVPDPPNVPPQIAVPVDDGTRSCVVCSASTSVPPPTCPLRSILPPPHNWYRIPQRPYDHGQKQWGFTQLGRVSFEVDGFPGMNMGDAFRKRFTGLIGRDDPVLRDARGAASCRLLVRLL